MIGRHPARVAGGSSGGLSLPTSTRSGDARSTAVAAARGSGNDVRELKLRGRAMASISGLTNVQQLRTLDLRDNVIVSVHGLQSMPNLEGVRAVGP